MKLENLGINPNTGTHSRILTRTENLFLGILWIDHVGEDNKISADELAVGFDLAIHDVAVPPEDMPNRVILAKHRRPRELNYLKRDVRYVHNHLLVMHDQVPILSKAGNGGGYWIAESEAEASAFYDTFRKRGLTGLVKASRGKKAALVDMMQQLSFEFEELVDQTGYTGMVRRRVETPTPIEVVDAFLERMLNNPERFADGLRKIGQKYGSVLLPKEQIRSLKAKTAELQELMTQIGIME